MWVALCSLGWSGMAAALGMGEIRLHSALNQPLNAEIQLIETAGLDPEDIVVKLASPDAFTKAGIERVFFLNDLRFTPVIRGNSGYIQVSSNKAVVEPYLSFVVQLSRPNGDLLHEYTLLLDPANTPEGLAATRNRKPLQETTVQDSRMPKAPPMAVQGKHYIVTDGDTLNSIARRLQGPGSNGSAAQLADGIQALNPQAFPTGAGSALRAGQNLLLPDAAVVPKPPAVEPSAADAVAVPVVADAQKAAQLAADAIENQQLEDLKSLNRALQEQVFERDKAVTVLQARLAEMRDAAQAPDLSTRAIAGNPAAPAAVVAPAAAPAAEQASTDNPLFSLPVLLGVVAALLLLILGLRLRQRRQSVSTSEHIEPAASDERLIKPAQAVALPVYEVPVVAPPAAAPAQSASKGASLNKVTSSQRLSGAAPDALDGVSIYIAYGRFNEALAILRDALSKQPERADVRERILELLGEQGDIAGFEQQEQAALEHGLSREQIQGIRDRYPQLKPSPAVAATGVAVGAAAAAAAVTAMVGPAVAEPAQPKPEAPAQLDETAAAALNPEHDDEFQLNLDDLSMDADWDLVDPFDKPAHHGKAEVPEAAPLDPHFASNLTELPEVFELDDEPFRGASVESAQALEAGDSLDLDYGADDSIEIIAPSGVDQSLSGFDLLDGLEGFSGLDEQNIQPIELVEPVGNDALDDAFLDSFADDDGMEFDLMELDEEPLTQVNQAQLMIDEGDVDGARRLLEQVVEYGDEAHQQMARDLLSSLD
ncbi:peptigoglycan-binding protein LysM [Pseudomonas sp. 21LCFQ02]|uniref:FimV/HubP family polar landmark protein n=1 Tax=Pseudomonas sp. 21LCFQ02 TaxID=2957505 RepID=UPI00209B1AF8|nr:FimV/HubP family polar landmark protein [Pseudomonas sp. 21LCFQ02]MCO8169992.1 peptigoglycan-binding protein LysM [Pseudomonas sp. 21LCFQ02]